MLGKLSSVPITTLILTGETGTGKSLAARIVHHSGRQQRGRLIEVNCAAIPHELLEAELFGHESGAFTGARGQRRGLISQADGGTLFLDEIGELDLALQAKLLHVIEERQFRRLGGEKEITVDCQVIVATNRNLADMVQQGEFRADLYHRLNVISVELPTLRSRIEDLQDLLPPLLAYYSGRVGGNVRFVSDTVWSHLRAYNWPGNVRELRNVLERCVLMATDESVPLNWLRLEQTPASLEVQQSDTCLTIPVNGSRSLESIEREVIETVLERSEFNVSSTARLLGLTRETMRYRLDKLGIRRK